jgi:hypothetical protein
MQRRVTRKKNPVQLFLSLRPSTIDIITDWAEDMNLWRSQLLSKLIYVYARDEKLIEYMKRQEKTAVRTSGGFRKCPHYRWNEKKQKYRICLPDVVGDLLTEMSQETEESKSECIEFIIEWEIKARKKLSL